MICCLFNCFVVKHLIDQPLYLYNERAACGRLRSILTTHLSRAYPTSEEEDMIRLAFLRDNKPSSVSPTTTSTKPQTKNDNRLTKDGLLKSSASSDDSAEDTNWKLLCALTYRITRKRILKNTILLLDDIINWIDVIIQKREASTNNDLYIFTSVIMCVY